jgi:hypothetical protein
LEQIAAGDLGLWATRWDDEPTLSRDDAFAHHDLVAVLCDAGPCLPVRFGTWLTDEAAARRELAVDQGDVRHESCPSAEVALSLSLLARRDEADALKARAMTAVAALEGVRGVVSGPWPPYSFTAELERGRGG